MKTRSVFQLTCLVAFGSLVLACAEDKTVTPEPKFGWRSAGLVLPDADQTGGLRRLVNIGNTLFAMDSYEPGTGPASRPRKWRIWKGSVGSDRWELLPLPNGEIPSAFGVFGDSLIVGTQYVANLYLLSSDGKTWLKQTMPSLPSGDDSLPRISAIGEINKRLAISIVFSLGVNHRCLVQSSEVDTFARIPCMGSGKRAPFYSIGREGEYSYGYQSEWGVARYRIGDSIWETLPSPRGKTDPSEFEFLSTLSSINGKIYVGYEKWSDGIFRWDDGVWTSMTPMDAQKRRETSKTVHVIAGYRGRLFQGGQDGSGIGMLIPRDSGKVVWGDWKLVDKGWCEIEGVGGCPWQTRAIVGIGDTLYAATWNAIVKVPFSELDQMARPMYSK